MKPFDLNAALAGKPVVNRSGTKAVVTKLAMNTPDNCSLMSQGANGGEILAYHTCDGASQHNKMYDLFMGTEKVTLYLNLYRTAHGKIEGYVHDYENGAKAAGNGSTALKIALPVTVEL